MQSGFISILRYDDNWERESLTRNLLLKEVGFVLILECYPLDLMLMFLFGLISCLSLSLFLSETHFYTGKFLPTGKIFSSSASVLDFLDFLQ